VRVSRFGKRPSSFVASRILLPVENRWLHSLTVFLLSLDPADSQSRGVARRRAPCVGGHCGRERCGSCAQCAYRPAHGRLRSSRIPGKHPSVSINPQVTAYDSTDSRSLGWLCRLTGDVTLAVPKRSSTKQILPCRLVFINESAEAMRSSGRATASSEAPFP
jgi:hypothetical protein